MSRVDDALLLRDTIQKIVNDKLGQSGRTSYATVTGFNPAAGTVTVIFDGDDIEIEIPAGSIYPSEIGQVVKIGGPPGAHIVEDVMGENLTEVKARTAQATADGKNTVNYGEVPPDGTDHKDGDIWFDESNSNMPHVWNGTEWKSIEDLRVAAIKAAQDELKADLDTVMENGVGTKSFYKPTQPTLAESKEGDLWFDTSEGGNNELHTFVNGAWVSAADARIAAIQAAQDQLSQDLDDIVENGLGTQTHYSPTQPAANVSKEGDLWFNTATGGNKELHVFTGGAWVSAADARIAEVKAAQAEMEGDITAAQQKADEAFQDAADADSKAATAQSAASAAAQAAADAAGIANGKGKVLVQSTAPGAADRNAQTLWIDTTGGANTPKRWTSGTTWTAVTDKAATDAAAAAVAAQTKANEAKSAADAAQTTATNAQTAADAAGNAASQAQTKANEAKSAADAAQSTATTAKNDAAAAAGIAGGKADVLIQSTTPATAMRKDTTLWIDTTGNANTPKRWNGTAWVVVTDKTATDAATAAAAAQSKADQAKAAADAAQSAANAAQSTATEALTSANSKNTVTRSTAVPTTPYSGRVDDIWWRMSTLGSGGRVIGQYRWNGTSWLVETIDNAVIATLDAAKITTGYLAAARIQANTLNADTVLINGSLGSIILRDGAITTPKIAVGAITAESGVVASLDAGKITVGTLDAARLAANSITADKILVSDFTNLNTDPTFAFAPPPNWTVVNGGIELTATGAQRGGYVASGEVAVQPGEKFYGEMTRQTLSGTASGEVTLYIQQYRTGTNTWTTPTKLVSATSDGRASGTATLSADTVKIKWGYFVQSSVPSGAVIRITDPVVRRLVGSTLIEPGAITTEKIATGAITAQSGIIASLDAGKITVGTLAAARFAANTINADSILVNGSLGSTIIKNGAITTEKLAVGAITAESGVIGSLDASKITVGTLSGARLAADAINGMQIIGATIATSTGFPRVQLDSTGLAVYKSSSVRSFFADAATGDLDVVGNFRTGTSGPRVEVSSAPTGMGNWLGGETGIVLFSGAAGNANTVITSQSSAGTFGGGSDKIKLGDFMTIRTHWSATGGSYTSEIASTAGYVDGTDTLNKQGLRISDTGGVFISGPNRINLTTDNAKIMLAKADNSATIEAGTVSVSASTFSVASDNFSVVPDGISEISSTNIRPIRISYTGTGSSWLIPFRKGTTEWGYVGSTGAMSADDFGIQSAAGKTMVVTTTNTTDSLRVTNRRATLEMNSYTARFDIDNSSGGRFQVPAIYNVQASGSANVVVNAQGTMFRPSSSLRYKQDIQDFSPSPSILDIETKTWRDKTAVTLSEQAHEYLAEIGQGPLPRDLQEAELEPCRHFGAIAEEVDALGLSELVEYDHAGRPDALKYPMFGVALIPEVRKLRDRIAALESLLDTPTGPAPVD